MTRFAISLVLPGLLFGLALATACESGDKMPAEASDKVDQAEEPKADAAKVDPKADSDKPEDTKDASGAEHYGAALVGAEALAVSELLADPRKHEGKMVRVEGMVVSVCAKRGCWFEMAGDQPGAKIRFKVKDGTMVFPPTAKGKMAVAEGEVSVKDLSLEQSVSWARHMASDAGREFDESEVKEPLTIVQLDGKGADIRVK